MLGQLIRLAVVAAIGCSAVLLIQSARAADTVDSLAADSNRLREVERLCRTDWAATGEELCTAASKARRKRFMGSSQTPYEPRAVDLFPTLNEDGSPKEVQQPPAQAVPARPEGRKRP